MARGYAIAQPSVIFYGGHGHGYSSVSVQDAQTFLTKGGINDGGDIVSSTTIDNYITAGGNGDGNDIDSISVQETFLTSGGDGDGYNMNKVNEKFIWTGAVGTGWNVQGNWNHNVVPDIDRPVVIPAGVPNFPFVNNGVFAIGSNPNNGDFTCYSLCILNGAKLTTRINNRVENYGLIEIEGQMDIKRTNSDAFLNQNGGKILIKTNGLLNIKP